MIIGPTIWAAKAAILALYIRVFGPVRWLRITLYGLIIFMFLFYWSNVAISAAYCIPRNGSPWNAMTFANCAKPAASVIVIGVLDLATDLVIFVEVHLAIIVSCAPALSSFWINIVNKSKWYSSLRSGASSWALHSKHRKVESTGYPQKVSYQQTASSAPKIHHNYDELDDNVSEHIKGIHTIKNTSAGTQVPMANIITKSTHIVQSSERV
ncbi:MAG: hypothetical protein Q9198_001285 [Flavoplaca austrocitrina]